MLAKENRLRKTKEFQSVTRASKGVRQGGLLLKVGPPRRGGSRVGIVVSKKVSKQAVMRNRIRRVLREALRRELAQREVHADIVLTVFPEFESVGGAEADRVVHSLLQRVPRA